MCGYMRRLYLHTASVSTPALVSIISNTGIKRSINLSAAIRRAFSPSHYATNSYQTASNSPLASLLEPFLYIHTLHSIYYISSVINIVHTVNLVERSALHKYTRTSQGGGYRPTLTLPLEGRPHGTGSGSHSQARHMHCFTHPVPQYHSQTPPPRPCDS